MTTTPQAALLSDDEIERHFENNKSAPGRELRRLIGRSIEAAILAKLQATQAGPTSALIKWANSPELVETGNDWQQGYEHARAWVHVQLATQDTQAEPVQSGAVRNAWPTEPVTNTAIDMAAAYASEPVQAGELPDERGALEQIHPAPAAAIGSAHEAQ